MKRKFKKLSNVEHVRLRTGMWLGQNSTSLFEQHFFRLQEKGNYQIEHREIEEIPAKLKCLDEACMNAIDEYNRNLKDRSIPAKRKMKFLKVSLSQDRKRITIEDDGRGIPTKNAEQVFLHLMYGENFDDELKKEHVAGQNGVGISLVRIVSSYFKVITKNQGKQFEKLFTVSKKFDQLLSDWKMSETQTINIKQYFDEHGTFKGYQPLEAKQTRQLHHLAKKEKMLGDITPIDPKEHGTLVEFELDEKYFNQLDIRFNSMLVEQYLQDLAMTNPGMTIYFSDQVQEKKFFFKKGLEDIFSNSDTPFYKIIYENQKSNLELISFAVNQPGKNLSWINSNFSSLGGSSIEYLTNLICDEIRKKPAIISYEKKMKTSSTRNDVRHCFHLYNSFHLIAPRFKSQDKSYLINDLKEDIRKAVQQHLDKMIRKLNLIHLVKEEIRKRTHLRELDEAQKKIKKTSRSIITKLIPCTARDKKVFKTLFIGEGDSAIAGLRQVRDPYTHALFPLRGKPLNVRQMPLSKAIQNEEIGNIVSILNLPFNQKTFQVDQLTFNRISIITDADYDGYAIRSLMLNFFFEYWPELYQRDLIYLVETPLYEILLENSRKEKKLYYCIDETDFNRLMSKAKERSLRLIRKKRNKGLGETSSSALAYALENGMKKVSINQVSAAEKIQNLWFHKDEAAQRRKEISSYQQLFLED